MKKIVLAAAVLLTLGVAPGSAEAQSRLGGCLKYGLGGTVAGHFVGGHRLKGAVAGCALGIYQRRKYEREVRKQNELRTRNPERRRAPNPDPDSRYDDRDRSATRAPLPRREGTSPYEDLGLERGRRTTREQATVGEDRMGNRNPGRDGYESGGSFARGQHESRDRFGTREEAPDSRRLRRYEPEQTGSFPPRPNGEFY
ncbi:hypothetical protein [Microvirga aerophila]|uniref:Glycine zipper domain-containing protein n=1 Tax=Microvirga aerophila TaxID=670291 RepID=A0A512C2L2_9HYPH|nr:hypothetical protein [Microvirga aerophila]GEO18439.1 hypothetical protein MAE02_61350 [Microvirga aerophila]